MIIRTERFPGLALIALLSLTHAACGGGASNAPEGMPSGINDTFLSDDLDVEHWVERFEGESREVYVEREAIADALDLSAGDRIADIGAGTGFFTALFAERVDSDGRVYAVEVSPKFLEHLRARAAGEGMENVRVVEGTQNSVELPPDSVDIAFVCDVYHHFESPDDSLASLRRAIRPGGSLVIIEFERIPGESPDWLLEHVRAGREVFTAEIQAAGFTLVEEIELDGLKDNYILRFERPETETR